LNTKICKKCGRELSATNDFFYVKKDNGDGLRNECKECFIKRTKQYQQENKIAIANHKKIYRQKNKPIIAEKGRRYRQQNKEQIALHRKQYLEETKEYWIDYRKRYYAKNKDYIIKRNNKWTKNNPDKQRKYDQARMARKKQLPATLTEQQWRIIKDYFNNRCAYCGKELPLQQDHFISLFKGGEYTHNNIIPACISCNASKRERDFKQWYPNQKFYSKKREKAILKFLGYTEHAGQQLALMI